MISTSGGRAKFCSEFFEILLENSFIYLRCFKILDIPLILYVA